MKTSLIMKLADYMEALPDPASYNQNAWLQTPGRDVTDEDVELGDNFMARRQRRKKVVVKEGACGTAMCVLGHAVGALPEANLFFYADASDIEQNKDEGGFEIAEVGIGLRHGRGYLLEFDAAAKTFDIPREHAAILFGHYMPGNRTGRFYGPNLNNQIVATRLREYVALDGKNAEEVVRGRLSLRILINPTRL